ncbi:MAG: hypothetical protein GF317_16595 [Candidatus Lokiarchaeota archaeon]|nr:hypothetical protein [Candidatus Lokiarchaeota archaeon]MBD3201139.1 hypothetical protein [Candidatus Lokiarchaeota archaeon]
MGNFDDMKNAYELSAKMMDKKMSRDRPLDYEILKDVRKSSVVIVAGSYDRVEMVLDLIKVPYVLIQPTQFHQIDLRSDQILIINCPGNITKGFDKINKFVEEGGFLFTTDWALLNILEKVFPGYVKYNQRPTGDDCVAVQIVDKSNSFLEGLFESDEEPIWWLENSSYPIRIENRTEVKVLIASKEMKSKYGEDPIVITFDVGMGTILHMTSHYYLQRADLRNKRHKTSAKEYAKAELGLSDDETQDFEADFEKVSLGEAESAYSTTQFIGNVIIEQQKRVKLRKNKKIKKKEDSNNNK